MIELAESTIEDTSTEHPVIKSADGITGCLLYNFSNKSHVFRVYNDDHTFKDYVILHGDLTVTIQDKDAFFYVDDTSTLDHSPATLGLKLD
jgi:hypothetical protein